MIRLLQSRHILWFFLAHFCLILWWLWPFWMFKSNCRTCTVDIFGKSARQWHMTSSCIILILWLLWNGNFKWHSLCTTCRFHWGRWSLWKTTKLWGTMIWAILFFFFEENDLRSELFFNGLYLVFCSFNIEFSSMLIWEPQSIKSKLDSGIYVQMRGGHLSGSHEADPLILRSNWSSDQAYVSLLGGCDLWDRKPTIGTSGMGIPLPFPSASKEPDSLEAGLRGQVQLGHLSYLSKKYTQSVMWHWQCVNAIIWVLHLTNYIHSSLD